MLEGNPNSQRVLDAASWSAAMSVGARRDVLPLVSSHIQQFLRCTEDDLQVRVVDARGNVRQGVDVEMLAAEVRAQLDGRSAGRYFIPEG